MLVIALIALLGFVTVSYTLLSGMALPDENLIKAQASVHNMLLYRQAAVAYYTANPSATGVIADASMTSYLPSGYAKNFNWVANISGGYAYVYTSDAAANSPMIANVLAHATEGSYFAGKNVGGNIVSSLRGDTGIALPVFVPSGSPVLMGK